MQKLKSEKGSTLVAVVVFAIVAAIGAAGYMHVMSNTVSNEVDALNDEKAHLTAESGINLGLRWLREVVNWENKADKTFPTFTLNGMDCNVSIKVVEDNVTTEENEEEVAVISKVTHEDMPYTKILKFTIDQGPFMPAMVVNNLGAGKEGLLNNIVFDGYVHFNIPIKIEASQANSSSGVRFLGPVTVRFPDDYTSEEGGPAWNYIGGRAGDTTYKWGVYKKSLQEEKGADLDSVFKISYNSPWDSLGLDKIPEDGSETKEYPLEDFIIDALGVSFTDIKPGTLPYLYFTEDGRAIYNYIDNDPLKGINGFRREYLKSLDPTTKTYTGPDLIIHDRIIKTENNIGVLGIVKGNVTVMTDDGNETGNEPSIRILGDLVYDHFKDPTSNGGEDDLNYFDNFETYDSNYVNSVNFGVYADPEKDTSFITLVSDSSIQFGDPYLGNEKIYLKDYTPGVEGGLTDITNDTTLFVTAALIARDPGEGLSFRKNNVGDVYKSVYVYKLRNIGSIYIDKWSSYFAKGEDRPFYFYNDRRINGNGLQGPGIPDMASGISFVPTDPNSGLKMLTGTWSEENTTEQ